MLIVMEKKGKKKKEKEKSQDKVVAKEYEEAFTVIGEDVPIELESMIRLFDL